MTRVFVGIGSNAGDRRANLRRAIEELPDVVGISSFYETEAVGDKHGDDDHLNAVVELETTLSPRDLLREALAIEERAGRDRSLLNIPVPLDVDILLYGNLTIDEPDLVVPHPRMSDRRFVLVPLSELAPELVDSAQLDAAVGAVVRAGSL